MKNFLLLIFTFLSINSIFSQATCATADPICVGNVIAPPSGLSNPDFGAIGCNTLTTNASWYVFKVGTSGNIDFSLHQGNNAPFYNNNDVNFVCWGPFSDNSNCSELYDFPDGNLNGGVNNIVACSSSVLLTENFTITSANANDYYVLLVTNLTNQPGTFVLEQLNTGAVGAGSTDCNIMCGVNLGPTASSNFPSSPAINTVSLCSTDVTSYVLHCNFEDTPANAATLSYQWYLDGALQPALTTKSITITQAGTWRVVVTHPNCGTASEDSVIIAVTPNNTVTASTNPTVCINTPIPPNIIHNTTGATGIGAATGLPAGVTATWNAGQITISGTATATGTFIYDIPLTGGCGSVNATGTITVNPDNTVSAPSSTPTLCVNTPLTSITHDTTGATGIGTVTGLPAGVTASWNAGQIIISGTPTTAVGSPFNYSIPLTGGCGSVNATGTITVMPINTVTPTSVSHSVFINLEIEPISFFTQGATGIGTPINLPPGLTAVWVGNLITITGIPTTVVGSPFTFTIPLIGGCGNVNATGTICVGPKLPPICGGNISPRPSNIGPNLGSPGCLGSAPNGNWYAFQVGDGGNLTFNLHQGNNPPALNNLDVDYICWGPFTDEEMAAGCTRLSDYNAPVSPSNIVGCSYSASPTENITINNASPGANYVLLITNFSNQPAQFVMTQTNLTVPPTPGAGTTSCDVVCGIKLGSTATSVFPDPPAINTISICDAAINSYTLHCNFENPPANAATLAYQWYLGGALQAGFTTKSITVTQSGTWRVVVTHPDCGVPSEDSVIIKFGALPVLNQPPTQLGPLGDCNPTFNLTSLIPALLAPLNPADFTVYFFTDYIDALVFDGTPIGNITNPSTFQVSTDTVIYVRALNNAAGCLDEADPDVMSFLLDVRCDATATGNTICTGNTGELTFTGPPNSVVTFTEGSNTYNVTLNGSGSFVWTTPTPLTTTTVYTLTNVAVGSPANNTALNSTATITVTNNNTAASASSTPTVCINTPLVSAVTHITTGATGIGTPINLPAGVNATWAPDMISISGTPTVAGVFNYSIPLTGGCGVINATGTIIVTTDNTVSAASSTPTLCINTVLTTINHTTAGATGIGTATDLPAGVTATWSGGTIFIDGTPTVTGTFNYTIPLTGGCGVVNAIGIITVNPNNTVTAASSTPTLCLNGSVSITHDTTGATGIGAPTNLPAGVTATWIGNQITISGTATATGVFNYDIPLTGGCGAFSATGTITVNPSNTVSTPSSTPTLCINTQILPVITHATTGATGIGAATNLPTGVTANFVGGNTIEISGVPTVAGIFNYDIPLTGGCGTFSATGTITVTPDNIVSTASATPELCVNTLLTPFTHDTTGATGIGAPTNLPAGVTATWIGNQITISGTPTAVGIFNYSIPLTGGCGAINAVGTITVNPDNTVSAPSSTPTVCVNMPLSITHTTTGATGIGAAINLPAGVTATWNAGQITISGTPTVVGIFNYDVPLTGGCGTFSATGTITVNPNNTVTAPSSTPTLCVNTLMASIFHTTTGATGIGTATNLPTGVTASWNADMITISGTPTASGIFNYSIPLTGGCGGVATGTITVNPDNTVSSASATPILCINGSVSITHNTTGATGIGAATNLPAGVTATWNAGQITISGTATATGVFNYDIPLTGGCGTFSATGTITVNPDNTVSAPSSTPTLCVNTPLTSITHNTTGATGIGTATGLPAGVTATWNAGQIIISGTPTTAVGSPFSYSIPLTGGCGTFSATGTITVIPSNTVTAASATPTLCVDTPLSPIFHTTTGATGIGVATGLPAGVTASWVGNQIIISGTPTTAVGSPFNYTIPLTGGCSAVNATGTITVNPAPTGITISPVPNVTTCAGVGVNLTVTGTAGSVITWTGSSTPITIGTSGIASVTVFPVVDTVYTLISATLNGCTVPVLGQSTLVIVSATPQFINSNISDITICDGELLNLESQLGTTIAGATVVWSASASNIVNTFVTSGLDATNLDQTIDLENPLAVGTITIQVVPKIGNCFGTPQTIEVIITPRPDDLNSVISALPATPICDNESVSIKLVTPLATQYNWQMSATNNVNIVGGVTSGTSTTGIFGVQLALIDNLQQGNITFEVTPFNGSCSGATQTITITVNPIPKSPVSLPEYEVCSEEEANLVISLAPPFIDNTILEWQIIPSSNVTVDVVTASPSAPLLAGQSVTILDVLKNESDTQGFVIYRVTSKLGNCVGATVDYMVRVNPLPKPILTDGHICVNQATGVTYQGYVLDTQLSNPDYAYSWLLLNTTTNAYEVIPGANDSTYETMEIGEYQVIVTSTVTNCVSKPVTADVNQIFPATAFSAVVTDAFTDNATITVTVNPAGTGNLIYSLDGGAWQASNVFTGVQAGLHEIMVEDVEGCTNLTQSITVIDYPKYFTPNGDGIHDNWNVIGLNQADAKLYIFDRYGKLIKQISPTENSKGWDGTYNGQQAPSTDYWFTIDFTENNQQKQFKSHFSLKR